MKIFYVNLTAPFSIHMMYKENYLIRAFRENGEVVFIISTLEEFRENKIYLNVPRTEKVDKMLQICRVDFKPYFNKLITQKIRRVENFTELCINFAPDIIILNGIQFYNIQELGQIKKHLPNVRIYGDVSAAAYNSATNWISYYLLHKGIYRLWIRKVLKYFDKIFYVSKESKDFLEEMYKIPRELLEEQGLCCEVLTIDEKREKRKKFMVKMNLPQESIVFSHTGKMDVLKNTLSLIEEFMKTSNPDFRLLLAGAFDEEIHDRAVQLINADSRILFLGFLKYPDLMDLLSATDLYLQPGGPSQTLQTAIGCLCPVVVKKMALYKELLEDKGIYIDTVSDMNLIFDTINQNNNYLKDKVKEMERIANKINYKNISARFYRDLL